MDLSADCAALIRRHEELRARMCMFEDVLHRVCNDKDKSPTETLMRVCAESNVLRDLESYARDVVEAYDADYHAPLYEAVESLRLSLQRVADIRKP